MIRLISARKADKSERRLYETEMTSYALDTLPPLTNAQCNNLERLAAMPDDQINRDDISKLTDVPLGEMKRAKHYRPVKKNHGAG